MRSPRAQVFAARSGTAPFVAFLVFLIVPLASCHHPAPEAVDTAEAVPVAVATAHAGPIRARVAGTGQVKPAAGAELLVVPPQQARIAAMPKLVGDRVRKGELLVRFDIPSLQADATAKRSDLERGQAQSEAARQSLARLSGLYDQGIAARKEVEDARRDATQAAATVTEARAATAAARELAGRAVVRAPFDGVIVGRSRQVGDLVDPGAAEPLLRLIDPARLQVEVAVPAADLGRIALDGTAEVRGGAFPEEKARVIALPPTVDAASGTSSVRLAFERPTRRPAGLAVDVEIAGPERSAAVLVPVDALVQEGTASAVFVVAEEKGGKKAHRRAVSVGMVADGQAEILAGLNAGETVVVRGQRALPDGASVEPAPAADRSPREPAP